MLAAAAEPRFCLLVGWCNTFQNTRKGLHHLPPNYAPTSSRAFVIYWWKACVDSCVLKYSDFLLYLRMVAVIASDPSVFARVRASVADPYRHVFRPLECSARLRCWTERTLKWTLTDPHKDPSGVGPGSKAAWLCFVSVSQALWDTPFCSMKAFSEPRGISVMLFHSSDADSSLHAEIFLLLFLFLSSIYSNTLVCARSPRPPSSGTLHVKAFMTLFYLSTFWKLHLNIFQKQRALIKSHLSISFITGPSISESQWVEKSNSLFTLPSSPWQIEVQFAALWQRPLSPKIAPINFCTVLLPITWSEAWEALFGKKINNKIEDSGPQKR